MIKILHTGDLHLDSPFCGTDALRAEDRREAQRDVLRRIFECARTEGCDLILIAGDLFDGRYVTPETAELVCRLFREAGCPVVVAPGNHDPYGKGSFWQSAVLPDNVFVFSSSELQCFELEEKKVRVFGYAFSSAALPTSPLAGQVAPPKNGWTHLLCAHADLLDPTGRYAPLTVGDILGFGVDYAALGHIHNRAEEDFSGDSRIRYCGFAEGRSFDEPGDGGVWLVTLEPGETPELRRRVLSEQRYLWEDLDVSGCSEAAEVAARIRAAAESFGQRSGTHLRLNLTGTADGEWLADLRRLAEENKGTLASLELKDLTIPYADGAYLQQDVTLRGAFYRTLYGGLIDENPEVRRRTALALQIGLAAIDQKRIPGRREEQ